MSLIVGPINDPSPTHVKRGCARADVTAFDAAAIYISIMSETSDVTNQKFYTYILYSFKDKGFYIGFTNNLKKRLTEHAGGKIEATKNRLPIKLIHYEYFVNRRDAEAREKFLKSGYGRKQFKEILKHTIENL